MSYNTEVVGQIAGIVSLVAFVPYILAIFRGETRPNRATWWIWTVVGLMLASSYVFSSGASHTIWVPVSYVIGPLVIAILSIRYGEGGWTYFDRMCLFGAGVSLVLWWIFNSPFVALLINLFIDIMGALPTVHKVYYDPNSEDRTAWSLFFIGNTLNVFATEAWMFEILIYPVYMFLGSGVIAMLIFFRRNNKAKV